MSGLREQQKEQRRIAITRAAMRLFQECGYQRATIEQIGKAAGVSTPTVFNYFGTKQEILLEVLKDADRAALAKIRKEIVGMSDPVEILCSVERVITDFVLTALPAALWRELMPMLICGSGDSLPEAYKVINDDLVRELSRVFADLRSCGALRGDADVDMAVSLINEYSHLLLLRMCQTGSPDREAHSVHIRRLMGLIYHGLRDW